MHSCFAAVEESIAQGFRRSLTGDFLSARGCQSKVSDESEEQKHGADISTKSSEIETISTMNQYSRKFIETYKFNDFKRSAVEEGEARQLTVIFPNRSPLPYLDIRMAKRLADLGTDVVVLDADVRFAEASSKL